MIRLPSYLHRHPHSGIYYFRIAIPQALKAHLKQREWKKSLKTRCPIEAKRAARLVALQVEYLFGEIAGNRMPKKPSEPHFKLISFGYKKHPDGTVEMERVELDPDKPEEELRLLQGLTGQPTPPGGAIPLPSPATALLEEVIEEYCQEKTRDKSWTPKTETENRAIYKLLVRVVGNISAAAITHEVARDYKKTLQKLPPNLNKDPLYRSKTLEQILLMHPKAMAINTVNKNLTRTSSLFDWATRHGYTDKNYFEGLTLKHTKRADEERSVFTREDIARIFSHTPYATHRFMHPYYYWLPLLGLYTGARLDELCQLYLDDIYEDNEIWVISINDKADKKLKTKSSKRIIPIHPKLIDLGLSHYVQTLKDRKQIRLFPELKKRRDGYSQAASKWFSRYREKIGLRNLKPPKDFHSFRHTLVTELKNKSIAEVEVAAITGHSTSGITYSRYGKDYDIKILHKIISQLDFEKELQQVKPF